ncbi:MAG: ATP-binding protein [Methanolinea sp.]|jgi:MinD superfamily P-loop ATPase|nr:ATP-binding protein [Methanolinea sp.]
MKIAVASGKGGTGKTLVAANLASVLSKDVSTTLVDCDVEEPNLHLFFPSPVTTADVTVPMPVFDPEACNHCGKCAEFCRYGAISVLPNRILFFPELCHSCGGCMLVCPNGAIREEPVRIGIVTTSHPSNRLTLVTGILDEGQSHATPIIRAAKEMGGSSDLIVFDAAPGTTCSVVETVTDCDACILVTESTPFGLHDLSLAYEVMKLLNVPSGVVINRSDGEDAEVLAFCRSHGLSVLLTIPFDRGIAAVQNRGELISRKDRAWEEMFAELYARCRTLVGVHE